jgi:glycosyltransferase involved in cell wall biosynthesis
MYPAPDNPMFGAFVAKQVAALESLGVPLRLVANRRWRRGRAENLLKYASLLTWTVAAALHRDFDVIVAHYLYPTAWLARIASRISGRPYVLVSHGTDVRSVQRQDRIAARCREALQEASLVVAVSEALAATLREALDLPAGLPVAVVNMGVDRAVFRRVPDARAALDVPGDARVALFAGSFVEVKNVPTLIAAFDIALKAGRVDLLLLAGSDPQGLRASAEEDVSRRGIEKHVRFLGALPAERLAAAMTAADVLVLPSVSEALGIVLLEAMSCGTPVVASRVGGIPEIVTPECGRLVDPHDPEGLAEAVGEVVSLGKARFAEGCERAAAADDVGTNAAKLMDAIERHALGGERRHG